MLPVCLPALSFNALGPLAIAWAWCKLLLLLEALVYTEHSAEHYAGQ
jgi:hypothetical protein